MVKVYRHIRLDKNEPFYIGIGKGGRAKSRHGRNEIWNRIVSKTDYDVEILFDCLTRKMAEEKEVEFISLYGRINNGSGILANMTDGGEGSTGAKYSIERKKKRSLRYSGSGNPRATKVYCGHLGDWFNTISECADALNISQPYASRMLMGQRYNKYKITK